MNLNIIIIASSIVAIIGGIYLLATSNNTQWKTVLGGAEIAIGAVMLSMVASILIYRNKKLEDDNIDLRHRISIQHLNQLTGEINKYNMIK